MLSDRFPVPRIPPSPPQLEADLCVAAIYLGNRTRREHLIGVGWEFCDWGEVKDICSDIIGHAFEAATIKGHVSLLRLLLSSNPNYKPGEPLPLHLLETIIYSAACFGHKDAFDFALDNGLQDPSNNFGGLPRSTIRCLQKSPESNPAC